MADKPCSLERASTLGSLPVEVFVPRSNTASKSLGRNCPIDGRRLATPPQWRAGNGAWGCYRSHLLILEKCLLEGWHIKHHIDHHLGRLTQRRYEMMVQSKTVDKESLAVYTPDRWLVGQLPTKSNICGRKWEQTRFFNDARNADHSDAPFFAVLGPHRSGTSCVALVMHHLGVHMGRGFLRQYGGP
jgi:hypothetical protein